MQNSRMRMTRLKSQIKLSEQAQTGNESHRFSLRKSSYNIPPKIKRFNEENALSLKPTNPSLFHNERNRRKSTITKHIDIFETKKVPVGKNESNLLSSLVLKTQVSNFVTSKQINKDYFYDYN